jgi:hypothetical protein
VTFVAVNYLEPVFALGDEGGDGPGGLGGKFAGKQRALWSQGARVIRHVYIAGAGVQIGLLDELPRSGPTDPPFQDDEKVAIYCSTVLFDSMLSCVPRHLQIKVRSYKMCVATLSAVQRFNRCPICLLNIRSDYLIARPPTRRSVDTGTRKTILNHHTLQEIIQRHDCCWQ